MLIRSLVIVGIIATMFLCFLGFFKSKKRPVDILSVLIVIGMFTALIWKLKERNKTVKYALTRGQLHNIATQLTNYHADYQDLSTIPDHLQMEMQLKYLNDKYGRAVKIDIQKDSFELISYGEDGKKGGEDLNQDIEINWHSGSEININAYDDY